MGKAAEHAKSSVALFGGKWEDYISIHNLLDSSRSVIGDVRHRMLTHNTWFLEYILPRIFGETITNSEGNEIPVRSIAERHVLEDYGNLFIPTPQDFLEAMELPDWMNNAEGGKIPPSRMKMKGEKPVISKSIPPRLKELIDKRVEREIRIPRRKGACSGAGRGVID